jgi:MmgE/PrpD N-terminal domain
MTSTDEILAIAAAAGSGSAELTVEVTEADLAAFRAAAARGADSDAARALRAVRPGLASGRPAGDPAWTAWLTAAAAAAGATGAAGRAGGPARGPGGPENAASAGSMEAAPTAEEASGSLVLPGNAGRTGSGGAGNQEAAPVHLAWLAVFAAGTALSGAPQAARVGIAVTAAVAAGMSAAAVIEAGLADWGGWSSGSVAGTVGAGVTAGLLLGLPEPRLRAAVGICATQAAGLASAEGTPALALQVGKAAFNGVEAALLARAGLTAPREPLDGRRGLFALFGPY